MTVALKLEVECRPGHRGDPEPCAFLLGARRFEVRELLDRWPASAYYYYKVRVDDGQVFILRHDAATGEWELAALVGPGAPAGSARCHDAATRH